MRERERKKRTQNINEIKKKREQIQTEQRNNVDVAFAPRLFFFRKFSLPFLLSFLFVCCNYGGCTNRRGRPICLFSYSYPSVSGLSISPRFSTHSNNNNNNNNSTSLMLLHGGLTHTDTRIFSFGKSSLEINETRKQQQHPSRVGCVLIDPRAAIETNRTISSDEP